MGRTPKNRLLVYFNQIEWGSYEENFYNLNTDHFHDVFYTAGESNSNLNISANMRQIQNFHREPVIGSEEASWLEKPELKNLVTLFLFSYICM